jgi:hypothetical protein
MVSRLGARIMLLVAAAVLSAAAGLWLSAPASHAADPDALPSCQAPEPERLVILDRLAERLSCSPCHSCPSQQTAQAILAVIGTPIVRSAPAPSAARPDDWQGASRQLVPELAPPRPSSVV